MQLRHINMYFYLHFLHLQCFLECKTTRKYISILDYIYNECGVFFIYFTNIVVLYIPFQSIYKSSTGFPGFTSIWDIVATVIPTKPGTTGHIHSTVFFVLFCYSLWVVWNFSVQSAQEENRIPSRQSGQVPNCSRTLGVQRWHKHRWPQGSVHVDSRTMHTTQQLSVTRGERERERLKSQSGSSQSDNCFILFLYKPSYWAAYLWVFPCWGRRLSRRSFQRGPRDRDWCRVWWELQVQGRRFYCGTSPFSQNLQQRGVQQSVRDFLALTVQTEGFINWEQENRALRQTKCRLGVFRSPRRQMEEVCP